MQTLIVKDLGATAYCVVGNGSRVFNSSSHEFSFSRWRCRYAPSLGDLEDSPVNIWGTWGYHEEEDASRPTVWFGLYGLNDFYSLWSHRGRKAILWAGSDIRHFINGYWLDDTGQIRLEPEALAQWIQANVESYVENGVEAEALRVFGIESKIVPSFLGRVQDYKVEFVPDTDRPRVYASVSGNDFALYGWDIIESIAARCDVDFYLYGNSVPWESKHSNVFVRGRVPKEVMNEEIKTMQCGLRVLEFDGFSEILAKSVLWGQYPISRIGYPHIDSFTNPDELVKLLNNLRTKTTPNTIAREYYLKNLNQYPWASNV